MIRRSRRVGDRAMGEDRVGVARPLRDCRPLGGSRYIHRVSIKSDRWINQAIIRVGCTMHLVSNHISLIATKCSDKHGRLEDPPLILPLSGRIPRAATATSQCAPSDIWTGMLMSRSACHNLYTYCAIISWRATCGRLAVPRDSPSRERTGWLAGSLVLARLEGR